MQGSRVQLKPSGPGKNTRIKQACVAGMQLPEMGVLFPGRKSWLVRCTGSWTVANSQHLPDQWGLTGCSGPITGPDHC